MFLMVVCDILNANDRERNPSPVDRYLKKKYLLVVIFVCLFTGEAVRTKWKGLRDTFRRECQKINAKKSSGASGGEKINSSWPYYKNLYFLVDIMASRFASGNIPTESCQAETELNSDDEDVSFENDDTHTTNEFNKDAIDTESITNTKGQSEQRNLFKRKTEEVFFKKNKEKKNIRKNDIQERALQIEEEKLNFFKQRKMEMSFENVKVYDLHFLMGLLPHLKNVRPERKLLVQMKLQQVLAEELNSGGLQPLFINSFERSRNSCTTLSSAVATPSSATSIISNSPFLSPNSEQCSSAQDENNYDITSYITNFKV